MHDSTKNTRNIPDREFNGGFFLKCLKYSRWGTYNCGRSMVFYLVCTNQLQKVLGCCDSNQREIMAPMKNYYLSQPLTPQQQASVLYTLLGRAVWSIQHLEDALNAVIAIKDPKATNRAEADKIRSSNRELPLGRAIGRAEKEKTFDKDFQKKLKDFLRQRNWLIHRCMHESVDDAGAILDEMLLFTKIRDIELCALSLKEAIETDMLNFCEANGRKDIREAVTKEYAKWLKIYDSN